MRSRAKIKKKEEDWSKVKRYVVSSSNVCWWRRWETRLRGASTLLATDAQG